MIYYFSGTGNSLHVARRLADALGERLSPMPLSLPSQGDLEGPVGLVFPVHAWGIPNVVEGFVRKMGPSSKGEAGRGPAYLYAVMTCGDDVGYTDKVLDEALLAACGKKLDAAFSVQMPNTYVCLPGFDVDSDEVCKEKLSRVEEAVKEIAACVSEQKSVRCLTRGKFPWKKTYILRPLFNRFLLTDKYFHVDASRCISCGRCRQKCPVGNILLDDVPVWQSHCAGCLACYHACPYHAINFGHRTQNKGQYNIMKQLYG